MTVSSKTTTAQSYIASKLELFKGKLQTYFELWIM